MRSRLGAAAIGVVLACAVVVAADDIRVVSLVKGGSVFVSFSLEPGLTPELQEAIRSGLPTTITYDVELRQGVSVWFDRTIQTVTVSATAQYDNLTRRHRLSRTVDGRGEAPVVTEDEAAVRRWLTTFERLPLFSTEKLQVNVEYYVRVRARSRPWTAWFFWPWDRGSATGIAKFTFIT
jgi:hypothetical protein